MPFRALDEKTALIVIDLQAAIVGIEGAPHPMSEVVGRCANLADAFRARGLPVVFVNVDRGPGVRTDANPTGEQRIIPADGLALVPELGQATKTITKHTPGAFTGTGLEGFLRDAGVTQVVVTGVATSNGVLVTVQQAYELGLNVSTPLDAMTDSNVEAHEYAVNSVFPKRAETGTAAELISLLEQSHA